MQQSCKSLCGLSPASRARCRPLSASLSDSPVIFPSAFALVEMKVTHEEMKAARVPLVFRDYCAHILIPLNECRVKTWYSPYKCTDLRHSYEKCQYDECATASELGRASVRVGCFH